MTFFQVEEICPVWSGLSEIKSELCLNQAYDDNYWVERNCLIIYVNLIMPVEVEACHKY